MATHQSGVILTLCSGLALIWSTQSQLIRTANSCDDIICPGGDVQYDCSVPNNGTVVWRMMPECERDNEQPVIAFFLGDPLMSIACNDGRKITVQGMETSNGIRFVSTLNVTNITSLQLTTECLFDDGIGSRDRTIGNNTVLTTAPAQGVEVTAFTPNVVLTLNQAISCSLIEYAVNSSTNCGICGMVIDDTITCNNALMGSKCTVEVETKLCGVPINQNSTTFDVIQEPSTLSTTLSTTRETSTVKGSLSQAEIIIAVVVPVVFVAALIAVIAVIVIAVIVCQKAKQKQSSLPKLQDQQSLSRKPPTAEENVVELEDMKRSNTKARDDQPDDPAVIVQDKSDRSDEVMASVADSSKDTVAATDNNVKVDPPEIVQDKSVQGDEVLTPVADSLKDTAVTESDNNVKEDCPESSQDISDQSDKVITHVTDSSKDTAAATENNVKDDPAEIVQDKSDRSDEVMASVADSSKDTVAATDNNVKEERSSDVFPNKEVSAEGKSSTDENQTTAINSSEGAGSTVHDPCNKKSDVPAVITLENTSVDQAGGNDTSVASSAKNESTKCDSATKHKKDNKREFCEEITERMENCEGAYSKLERNLDERFSQAQTEWQAKFSEMNSGYEQKYANMERHLKDLKQSVDSKTKELQEKTDLLNEKDDKINSLQLQLSQKDEEVEQKDTTLKYKEEIIVLQKDIIRTLRNDKEELLKELQCLHRDKLELEGQISSLRGEVRELQSQVGSLQNNLTTSDEPMNEGANDILKEKYQVALSKFSVILLEALQYDNISYKPTVKNKNPT